MKIQVELSQILRCCFQVHREMFPEEVLHDYLEGVEVKTDDDRLQQVT